MYSENVLGLQHYREQRPCDLLAICIGMPDCCSGASRCSEQFWGREKANDCYIFTALLFFDVLLTVHLSIILAINQLDAQNLLL